MPTLFKADNYNLVTLIQQIDIGAIGLPDIQRPFETTPLNLLRWVPRSHQLRKP